MKGAPRTSAWAAGIAVLGAASAAGAAGYVGSQKCKACHIQQHKSWDATHMAKAFDLLKPGERADAKKKAKLDPAADYTKDAKCLACHTTGYGKGGFKSVEETPTLAGVGCEACHGPGGGYLGDDKMSLKNKEYKRPALLAAGLVSPPTAETCAACHNDKSPFVGPGYKFDFKERKDKGTHEHAKLKYSHD